MNTVITKKRCAIYTRKSTEEGLDMEYSSLDVQRDTAKAYIQSQKTEGWVVVPDYYDDGGYSGGTLKRPALKRLLADIEQGLIDIVVVYKIDRLSRSLADFIKIMTLFEERNVSFVSVTQHFSTSTSIGRLHLNILFSFSQFEREITSERIRDKISASKQRGLWTGGRPPLGYDIENKKLRINPEEAKLVQHIFHRFIEVRSTTLLAKELQEQKLQTKTYVTKSGKAYVGKPFTKSMLYKILSNRIYLGEIADNSKKEIYKGQHAPIISPALWKQAHEVFKEPARKRANELRSEVFSPLKSLLVCQCCKSTMTPTHTRKKGKLYRYYQSNAVMKGTQHKCTVGLLPAEDIEKLVLEQVYTLLGMPEVRNALVHAIDDQRAGYVHRDIVNGIQDVLPLWNELFPAEQKRLLLLLIKRIDVSAEGIDLILHASSKKAIGAVQLEQNLQDETLLHIPTKLQKHGGKKHIVTSGQEEFSRKLDHAMIKALGRAYRWQQMLEQQYSVTDIARKEGVTDSYITRIVRLNFLAPDIVEVILQGRQSTRLSLGALVKPFPLEWEKQRECFI